MEAIIPIETTETLSESVGAGAHGIQVGEGKVYIGGTGVFETKAFRRLADWEVQQLTYVFPHLFLDMAEEYEREHVR